MSTTTTTRPRGADTAHRPFTTLARLEGRRMLRHPAPWIGILLWLAANYAALASAPSWSSAQYQGLQSSAAFLAAGVSIAAAYAAGRDRLRLAEDAPMRAEDRAAARLVGGLGLVALVAVVVAVGALWLRWTGGVAMGAEPGRTLHAHFTLPELLHPVALAAFAVAAGAAAARLLRHPLAGSIAVSVLWFVAGPAYWTLNGPVLRLFAPLMVQPYNIEVAPAATDPLTLPSTWLLEGPGPFQPYWARLVIVPELGAWHDLYLVAVTLLAAAVALPGRYRRPLLAAGAVLAVVTVLLQARVSP
ncbi:hypothetical protein N865_20340 [Intrasporangium oryzae NRRL B-24470]|uniref:Uncharacterized protein n=1 Tax=Intrasporangium oryzae NRRL B-24470 TaxID=1386089 RepID=W9G9X4_9MICO|nr:hypothetical protein [Intrasporangium oryzae]EWT02012.1 hypothetical protein N865_20340 [Intrasporangium oryzae NRRL B-24470]